MDGFQIRKLSIYSVLLLCGLIVESAQADGVAKTEPQVLGHRRVNKDAKLSSSLSILANSAPVGQEPSPLSQQQIETLPESIKDLMLAGQMRVTAKGEVQVYI